MINEGLTNYHFSDINTSRKAEEKTMTDRVIEATLLPNGNKVWDLGNGLYATTSWISPKRETWRNVYAYFVTLEAKHLMNEDGTQYAVLCTEEGKPINLSSDFVMRG